MRISDGSSDVCSSDLRFLNPGGIVHGGWVMTVLDSAMGLAAVTMLEEGGFAPTHETSVKFLKPIHADIGPLRVIGTVIPRGRSLIAMAGRIIGPGERIFAHGARTSVAWGKRVSVRVDT